MSLSQSPPTDLTAEQQKVMTGLEGHPRAPSLTPLSSVIAPEKIETPDSIVLTTPTEPEDPRVAFERERGNIDNEIKAALALCSSGAKSPSGSKGLESNREDLRKIEKNFREAEQKQEWLDASWQLKRLRDQFEWIAKGSRFEEKFEASSKVVEAAREKLKQLPPKRAKEAADRIDRALGSVTNEAQAAEWGQAERNLEDLNNWCSDVDREIQRNAARKTHYEQIDHTAARAEIDKAGIQARELLQKKTVESFQVKTVQDADFWDRQAEEAAGQGDYVEAMKYVRASKQSLADWSKEVKRTELATKVMKMSEEKLDQTKVQTKCNALAQMRELAIPKGSQIFKAQAKLLASMKMEDGFKKQQEVFMKDLAKTLAADLQNAYTNWGDSSRMPLKEKQKALQGVIAKIAKELEFDPPKLLFEDLGNNGVTGSQGADGVKMNRNPKCTSLDDFSKSVNTVIHETMHAWQAALATQGASAKVRKKTGVTDSQIQMFAMNGADPDARVDYISSSDAEKYLGDRLGYKKQPVEEHAYYFGEFTAREITMEILGWLGPIADFFGVL